MDKYKTSSKILFLIGNKFPFNLFFSNCLHPFPHKPWFLPVCCTSLLKTLWEKEKLLVTSNFSFSHSVFYMFGELSAIFVNLKIVVCQNFEFGRVKNLSFGKGLKQKSTLRVLLNPFLDPLQFNIGL